MRNGPRRLMYGMATVVALGFSVEWANAQDEAPLPASPNPPPEIKEQEKVGKPLSPPGRSPEMDKLLQKLKLSRADIEQRKGDKNQQELAAATDDPPDVKERKKAEKPPQPPGRSPDVEELLDKIRKQPGGAEKLERARKAGAKIPPGKAGGAELEADPTRKPGPRVEGLAVDPGFDGEQQPMMRVTKSANVQAVSGLGYLSADEYILWSTSPQNLWGSFNRFSGPLYPAGAIDVKPWLGIFLQVTNPGWYLINVVGTRTKASFRRWASGSYVSLTQWDNTASPNSYESYPHVANLAAGWHYLYWVPEGLNIYVSEVTLLKF
jgi:hypothetical protein